MPQLPLITGVAALLVSDPERDSVRPGRGRVSVPPQYHHRVHVH